MRCGIEFFISLVFTAKLWRSVTHFLWVDHVVLMIEKEKEKNWTPQKIKECYFDLLCDAMFPSKLARINEKFRSTCVKKVRNFQYNLRHDVVLRV